MKNLFPQYYRRTPEEFGELFKSAIFVFDANMLLHLYRYPKKARDDLFKILRLLSKEGRLWLPFQAALEYQTNRIDVIAAQRNKYGEVKKVIEDIQADFRAKLDALRLRKRHSSIDPDVLLKEISASFGKYIQLLDASESDQLDVHHEDKIRVEIDNLFKDRIGTPFTQPELENIFDEGAKRYKAKRPPGYKDEAEKKGTFTFYKNLYIKREFGDLVVWKEIINFIKQTNPNGLIFITDDNKDDWWAEVSGKTIGPQPALLSEIFSETGLSNFYIYNSERFMALASEHFDLAIEEESLEQVKRISRERARQTDRFFQQAKLKAVLHKLYGDCCQVCGFSGAGHITQIVPLSVIGQVALNNNLLLCPNHQEFFRRGVFSINDDLTLLGMAGKLTLHSSHVIDPQNLKYHRENIYQPNSDEVVL